MAEFARSRHLGRKRRALAVGDHQQLGLSGAGERNEKEEAGRRGLNAALAQVVQGELEFTIGHLVEMQPRTLLQRGENVLRKPRRCRPVQPAGLRTRLLDELIQMQT